MYDDVFADLDEWPVTNAAAAAFTADGIVASRGDADAPFELASLTKLLTAAGCLLACEELGADPFASDSEGVSLADLLAHAAGVHPSDPTSQLATPGSRRIYSNAGYELAAQRISESTELAFDDYLREGVFLSLGMEATSLDGSPAHAARSSVRDMVRFVQALVGHVLLAPQTVTVMTTVHLPDLVGVLPGYGRQDPNPWGLGPEIRGRKQPHWTAANNSDSTWGHFGQSGTFVWFDPAIGLGCVVLTDEAFGEWAHDRWPAVSSRVVADLSHLGR